MDPDHVWELQLGEPDSWENLEMIDSFTNRRIGQNLASQMRELDDGVRIKIVV